MVETQITTKISLKLKESYGQTRVYPSCPISKKLAELTNTKTFSFEQLKVINSLGFYFELEESTTRENLMKYLQS
jgi:hypothetical protein